MSSRPGFPGKGHKYFAKKCVVDGHKFPSKAEGLRYAQLAQLQRAGLIRELKLQPRFPLYSCDLAGQRVPIRIGKRNQIAAYVADFSYIDAAGKTHVEDVKGRDLPIGILKRAIVRACYGLDVEVIHR